jgi:hypothetical protein
MRWSTKGECMPGKSTRGMWQVTQFFDAAGQALPGWSFEGFCERDEAWQARIGSARSFFRNRISVRSGLPKERFLTRKGGGIDSRAGSARHWRVELGGRDFRMASRTFLGTNEIIQRGRLLCRPPPRRLQPLVCGHRSFDLPLRRRQISEGRRTASGAPRKRHKAALKTVDFASFLTHGSDSPDRRPKMGIGICRHDIAERISLRRSLRKERGRGFGYIAPLSGIGQAGVVLDELKFWDAKNPLLDVFSRNLCWD